MVLNADKAGVKISDRGMVEVNDHLQTSVLISMHWRCCSWSNVSNKAEEEGTMVAEILAGQKPHIDYNDSCCLHTRSCCTNGRQ
jgi:dihydrolipoamide dehydrogenase